MPRKNISSFAGLLLIIAFFLSACSVQAPAPVTTAADTTQEEKPRPTSVQPIPTRTIQKVNYLAPVESIVKPEVFISKGKRRLYVVSEGTLVRDYPVGLGKCPVGDKERQGDGRTPEGDLFITGKLPKSRFHKGLSLSYPTKKHAERAFVAGLINSQQFRDISLSLDRKDTPPQQTPLGGAIVIHGGGAYGDWTEGCVALYNSDMDELFRVAGVGTPVSILP